MGVNLNPASVAWHKAHKKWQAAAWDCRAFNPETKKYLHLSGTGETEGTVYAWRGNEEMLARLKGRDHGYVLLPIDMQPTQAGSDDPVEFSGFYPDTAPVSKRELT
jgi:hypothetical protein